MSRRKRWWRRTERTKHHVPPRSRRKPWWGFLLDKESNEHIAFHILFGNAATLQECIEILKRDWWSERR